MKKNPTDPTDLTDLTDPTDCSMALRRHGKTPLALLALALLPATPAAATEELFRDVTAAAGITFRHTSAPEKKYIVESMSGGVATFDYDEDGFTDLYFVNALTVETGRDITSAKSALYRNRGDGTFEDVSDKAGVAYSGWGMGVCAADVDGDGRRDFYVTNLGPNRFYRNRGDGTFEDLAPKLGITVGGWSTGCAFGDYDRDGDLDLFVSRYVKFDLDSLPEFGKGKSCQYRGIAVQCGPRGLPGASDLLFRNDGDRFTDVSVAAGVADSKGFFGLGVAFFDANADGWPDLFVANDSNANLFYLNRKDGTFEEAAFPSGVAVSEDGAEQGCMGVTVGDYDGSGRESLYVTNFAEEYNALYRNEGGYFVDVSFRSGSAASSLPFVGWGTSFFDWDNDTWLDLMVVNGHVYPQLDQAKLGASAPYRQRKLLYRNKGDGNFEEIGQRYGPSITEARVQRGLAVADFDRDGRLDVAINDLDGPPQLLKNVGTQPGGFLLVDLEGLAPNTDAIGALLRLRAGGREQLRRVRSGTSYLSQDDLRQHFGLAGASKIEWLEVLWPNGDKTRLENPTPNSLVKIVQPAKTPG